jgi:hypothetical protein
MRLSLRHTGLAPPDPNRQDWVVIDDGREVGRLHENPYDPPELRWFWSIIVIGAHQAGIRTNGHRNVRRGQRAIQGQLSQMAGVGGLEVES